MLLIDVSKILNVAYKLWKSGDINQKDDIRFHKDSNRLTKGMGISDDISPKSLVISNNSYDTLLLCSDGITDCLSDHQIKVITQKTSPATLARSLIEAAKHNISIRTDLNSENYNQRISAGKDNLSAAVYDNPSSYNKSSKDTNKDFDR